MYYDFEKSKYRLTSSEKLYILDNLPLHIRSGQLKHRITNVMKVTATCARVTFEFCTINLYPSNFAKLTVEVLMDFVGEFPEGDKK